VASEDSPELDQESAGEMLAFCEARRQAQDQMMWQVPALSVAAQAFLFSRSLDPATASVGRLITGLAGMVVAVATVQLIAKHRYLEEFFSRAVDVCRRLCRMPSVRRSELGPRITEEPTDLTRWNAGWRRSLVRDLSSFKVWAVILAMLAASDGFVAVDAAAQTWHWWKPITVSADGSAARPAR
jgi:hypothetical protein